MGFSGPGTQAASTALYFDPSMCCFLRCIVSVHSNPQYYLFVSCSQRSSRLYALLILFIYLFYLLILVLLRYKSVYQGVGVVYTRIRWPISYCYKHKWKFPSCNIIASGASHRAALKTGTTKSAASTCKRGWGLVGGGGMSRVFFLEQLRVSPCDKNIQWSMWP